MAIALRGILLSDSFSQDGTEHVEGFRVLAVFDKHHNKFKWFLIAENGIPWKCGMAKGKHRLLVRMLDSPGKGLFSEEKPEKNGQWKPRSVFAVPDVCEVLSVEGSLIETML